jgi:hypothetical protein
MGTWFKIVVITVCDFSIIFFGMVVEVIGIMMMMLISEVI